jgi:hypothetical protein
VHGDRLVGVVGAGADVQLGQDLGALLVAGVELLRDLEGADRALEVPEARPIDLAEGVEQVDPQLVVDLAGPLRPAAGA